MINPLTSFGTLTGFSPSIWSIQDFIELHTPEQDINNTLILAPDHTPERAEFSTPLSSPVQALDLSNTQYKASLVGQDGLLSEMKSHQAVTGGNLGSND